MELNKLTIKEVSVGLEKKEFTSEDVTKACLGAIQSKDKDLNAFITVTDKLALAEARASDLRRKKSDLKGSLDGVPIAVKDNMALKDFPTTAGSKMLESFEPTYDAFVIEKLKEEGMIMLGKTNMDEFAMGSSTESSYFGSTKNPYDTSRVPGGSSGGSAVSVASDESICALGSDTGGSIRQPASFCGVVGFKPTYGAVSRNGLFAMASSLDQIGPLTKSVEDAEILFDAISKYDRKDSTCSKEGISEIKKNKKVGSLKGLKIGVLKEGFGKGIDDNVKREIKANIDMLAISGADVEEISIPILDYALAVYYVLMPVEASSNLGRYDGVKYGFSVKDNIRDLNDVYQKSRAEGFGDEVKRRIIIGAYASSAGYIDEYYVKAVKVSVKIKEELDKVFEKFDCIVSSTTPTTAFKIGENKDPLSMYMSDILTVPANIAGLPSISIPVGEIDGLPVGLQITGKKWSDKTLLSVAKEAEKLLTKENG